jgi:hypothetical protein
MFSHHAATQSEIYDFFSFTEHHRYTFFIRTKPTILLPYLLPTAGILYAYVPRRACRASIDGQILVVLASSLNEVLVRAAAVG